MNEYVILTDSTSDLSKELREKYHIDYVKMNIVVNGKEMPATLDWDLYSPKELYDWMRNGTRVYTTQVPQNEYETKFATYLKDGKDILYISCSSALSGSINIANMVKEKMLKDYPGCTIVCVDSLNSCLGQGAMCIEAAKLKETGKTLHEVSTYLEENKLCFNQFATVDTLTYLKNAGRVKASTAFFGNIIGVKPIIVSDAKGQNVAMIKTKGRKASMEKLVELAKEAGINLSNQTIYLGHADAIADVMILKELVEKELHPEAIEIGYIGPIVGASTGPGTLAIYVVGKKVEFVGD